MDTSEGVIQCMSQAMTHRQISEFLIEVARHKPQDGNAENCYRWAFSLDPGSGAAANAIGRCALLRGRFAEAQEWFEAAMRLMPHSPEPCVNQAAALIGSGNYHDAVAVCQSAIHRDRDFAAAYTHCAAAYERMENWAASEQIINLGLKHCPNDNDLLYARSMHLLKCARTPEEWVVARDGYEHRPAHVQLAERLDNVQEWHGESLSGHNLLVCAEQGLGDQIMFSRYIPALCRMAANVHVHTRPELARLFVASFPGAHITTTESEIPGDIDRWVAMGSLGARFGSTGDLLISSIVYKTGGRYLAGSRKPPTQMEALAARVAFLKSGCWAYRIGLCWRGNPAHYQDPMRSFSFDALRPLLDIRGCEFFSLQRDDHESGLPNLADGIDMQETADAIDTLDLVIAADTGILHLTGALGVPTWLVQPTSYSDWRWEQMWYPSVVLAKPDKLPSALQSAVEFANMSYRVNTKTGIAHVDNPARILESIAESTGEPIDRESFQRGAEICDGAVPVSFDVYDDGTTSPEFQSSTCRYGTIHHYARDRWCGHSLRTYGEWSESEVDLFRALVHPGDHVADVGAHVGSHTLALAALVGESGMVRAFEPEPTTYRLLLDNIGANLKLGEVLLDVRNCGLGDREQVIESPLPDHRNPGGYSLLANGLIGSETQKIQLRALDDLGIERLDFIKADVEGAELSVLRGGQETIARCRPILYVEADREGSFDPLVQWMTGHEYRVYIHKPPLFNPGNFNGYPTNVWGNIVSLMLLGIPREKFPEVDGIKNLERVRVKRNGL